MDFFVVNGKIWQEKGRFCQALLVRNGRIVAAGTCQNYLPFYLDNDNDENQRGCNTSP